MFNKLSLNLLLIFSFLGSYTFTAQNQKLIDSLNREANILAYSNPELAINRGLELYEITSNSPSQQVSALLTVANAYAVLKDHDRVLQYALKADSIASTHQNFADRVKALGFIGNQYQRLKLNTQALHYLDRAYEVSVTHPLPDSIQYLQGNILFVKGLIQKDNLGCEYAKSYLEKAATVFKENNTKEVINANLSMTYSNIGDCDFELGNYEKARKNYEEAIFYASKVNSLKGIAYSKMGISNILFEQKEYQKSIQNLNEALQSIENINDARLKTQLYKALSKNYDAIADEENFNKYTSLYLEEEQKLFDKEKKSVNQIANNLASENLDKREDQKNTYTYIFIGCGILLVLLSAYLTIKILQKRRKIAKQKQKLEKTSKND